jgi:hypothetical protein
MGVWNKKRGRRNKIAEIAVHANTGMENPSKINKRKGQEKCPGKCKKG